MATGLTVSNTSALSSGQVIVVKSAKMAFEPAAPDPDLISSDRIGQGEKSWNLLTYARLSDASALTEGVDLSQTQQLVTASINLEPAEHGIIATVSKRLIRRQGDANVLGATGTMLANSLRRIQSKDVITLYDSFTKSIVGASNALDITHFRGGTAFLMRDDKSGVTAASNGPAQPPFKAALHIEQISDIILDITDTTPRGTTTGMTDEMLQRWWKTRDRLYGVEVFHSGNIQADSSDDAKGGLFSEDALYMVMANNADVTEETDESLRAIEIGIFQEWDEVARALDHGVEVESDCSTTV
jgi:hypothetical protein